MKLRRIKFIWAASRVIQGRWYLGLFGFYDRADGRGRENGLAVSVRGLLVGAGVLAVLAYVATATTVFWIWQRNPYNLLSYYDALGYPVRQAQIAEKKG